MKIELVALLFLAFGMSCYCKCFVALPQGGMGWSALCDCGIFPYLTHLLFVKSMFVFAYSKTDFLTLLAYIFNISYFNIYKIIISAKFCIP